MKPTFCQLFVVFMVLLPFGLFAQEEGKKKIEREMEQFKRQYQADFEEFKRKREQELKKLEQEYQDFYNTMLGLKRYYEEKKDTAGLNTVKGIIEFEEKVSAASGKQIRETEKVTVTPQTLQAKYGKSENAPAEYKPEPASKPEQPAEKPATTARPEATPAVADKTKTETPETTLKPLAEEVDIVPSKTPLPWEKSTITSPFGYRIHPVLKIPKLHTGVDFGSGMNTPVYAAANGKVVLADQNSTYGKYIVLEHKNGYTSVYAHLEKIAVSKGDYVIVGSIIGYSGNTGRSTGPHLHYEVRLNGTPVDPKGYLSHTK